MLADLRTRVGSQTGYNPLSSASLKPLLLLNPRRTNFSPAQALTLEMGAQSASKRPMCPSCSKPVKICLCTRMKTPILDNPIAVTILQHSLEKNHPLNTARIAVIGLKNLNLTRVSDVHSEADFHIYLPKSNPEVGIENGPSFDPSTEPAISFTLEKNGKNRVITSLGHIWMPLTPLENPSFDELLASQVVIDTLKNGFMVKMLQKTQKLNFDKSTEYGVEERFVMAIPPGSVLLFPSKTSVCAEEINFEVKNLIVLDGTWAKAKRVYYEHPWLKFLPHLKLDVDKPSLYSEVRREPRAGYLSSIESIVYALKAVGEDIDGLDGLLDVFESMVGDQRRCMNERLSKIT